MLVDLLFFRQTYVKKTKKIGRSIYCEWFLKMVGHDKYFIKNTFLLNLMINYVLTLLCAINIKF